MSVWGCVHGAMLMEARGDRSSGTGVARDWGPPAEGAGNQTKSSMFS